MASAGDGRSSTPCEGVATQSGMVANAKSASTALPPRDLVPSRVMRARFILAVAVLLCGALWGCEINSTLDMKKFEDHLEEEIEDQTDFKVKKIKCPDKVVEKKGDTFECTIETKEGVDIEVEVEMKGRGEVKWETVDKDKKKKDDDDGEKKSDDDDGEKKSDDDDGEKKSDDDADEKDSEAALTKGQKVEVLWKGKYYPAVILDVKDDGYLIHYDGFSSSWDETVKRDRIRVSN